MSIASRAKWKARRESAEYPYVAPDIKGGDGSVNPDRVQPGPKLKQVGLAGHGLVGELKSSWNEHWQRLAGSVK